ncbi:NADP-dependent oxidoreductase [Lentzea sp. BCCO 10_0798]|jgi:NADPH-dependent curcumin reductase CurA|uniref:NADP-dependent oxidoreductase n=1 Tax=Lentzea kristufekii TaxID=3095430 RepID=A0ABU4U735_9PSEU|nr:NADP-dependent oxidoreductase [Lentzea sp. BCCO 10_0798]MDX8056403.1 NADP-dependent oxidoreductase [Lentzea sp. BCCO 10_0798]
MSNTALEVRLASRPNGWPTEETFEIAEVEIPTPGEGQILVRNVVMSVDPYMRGRMNDVKSYVPPFQVGAPLDGGAVGEVVAVGANVEGFAEGDNVLHGLGWRDYAVVNAKHAVKVDGTIAPLSAYLGVLGMPGLTAYAGLLATAEFKPGDAVFVSGAAGAVGQIVGQIARLKGASRVIGSAGSADKVKYLTEELGFDAAFNYKDGPVAKQLAAAAPDGIDVYFDNVGGEHLEAAIETLNLNGRITMCGAISQYNESEKPSGPSNMIQILAKRLTLRGMLVGDHKALQEQFVSEVAAWIASGELKYSETVIEGGARQAPSAFLGMLRGENTGKMLVKF